MKTHLNIRILLIAFHFATLSYHTYITVDITISIVFVQIPASWLKVWDCPSEPPQYLRLLVAKTLALGLWEEKALTSKLLHNTTLDLSELFHPDTFLNALRQQTARYSYIVYHNNNNIVINYYNNN